MKNLEETNASTAPPELSRASRHGLPILFLIVFLLAGSSCLLAQDLEPTANPAVVPLPVPSWSGWYAPLSNFEPQTQHDRFMEYATLTFGPRALLLPLFPGSLKMLVRDHSYSGEPPDGWDAFGRHYGDSLARATALQTGRYLTAALTHEDYRYRPSHRRNFGARVLYALSYTVVDRSDSGHVQFAAANFVGAGASGFVGNLYSPERTNNLSHAMTRSAFAFGGLAGQNLMREFVPDLFKLTRKIHAPFPAAPIPDWWVKR